MDLKLSILDQSPIGEEEDASRAFHHTIALAQLAERLGYHRFWVAEHHDSERLAGSSPEVLIAHLLAKTERIRIGSGGVMLQHYSPYKVAENFSVLAALAPNRVDLGVGRAPGGLPRSTQALQQDVTQATPLSEKLVQLQKYLHDELEKEHPLYGLQVTPRVAYPPGIYLLGASDSSALLAAEFGLPYVFAQFLNGEERSLNNALQTYTANFQGVDGRTPEAILALSIIVAETDEEASELAGNMKNVKVHLASGKSVTVGTVEQADEFGRQANEPYTVEVKDANILHGSQDTVRQRLLEIVERTHVQEVIVLNAIRNFDLRIRSYELLKASVAPLYS